MTLLEGREEVRALLGEEGPNRPDHPARQQRVCAIHHAQHQDPGHGPRRRGLPRVRRCQRRPRQGRADRRRCQDQYVAVCNAAETLLVHSGIAPAFLLGPCRQLLAQERGVARRRARPSPRQRQRAVKPATESDWSTEYLDLMLAVKVVDSTAEAIEHINEYGSHHTDAIVTEDPEAVTPFCARWIQPR